MGFNVHSAGFSVTIQDAGRRGYQHQGVTQGGAVDQYSYRWANRLLGNSVNAAALEITYGGLVLEADAASSIAITGADLGATLNNLEIEPWRNYRVKAGDILKFGSPRSGLRAYLAVAGGILSPEVLGSRSVVIREGIGGVDNRGTKLMVGDYLPCDCEYTHIPQQVEYSDIPNYDGDLEIGVIEGYQVNEFSDIDLKRFYSNAYLITNNVDRMGYRLEGLALKPACSGIVSEGIALGAIQIPADGQPIVLMRDRQTIGGYPKIGCVFSLDIGLLAQRGPGTKLGFYRKDISMAQAQRQIFERHLKYFRF